MAAPRLVVIGAPAGGNEVLRTVLADLPAADARAATIRRSLLHESVPRDGALTRVEDVRAGS